jgi:hypothetical protein
VNLPRPRAAALLLGTGGAGAATMLALLLSDLQGMAGGPAARLGALAFAFLLTIPLVLAGTSALRPSAQATPQAKALVTLGTLLWLGGLGADLFVPGAAPALVTVWHSLGLVGGLAFAAAGWLLGPFPGREGETPAERRKRLRGA